MFLKNQTLPLEPWVFEIEDEADAELGDAEIIYHLAALVIGDTVDDLRVHQDLVERNQIRNEQAHRYLLVQDLILPLLRTGNPSQPEFNYQRVLIAFFVQTMAKFIENFKCAADDLVSFLLQ